MSSPRYQPPEIETWVLGSKCVDDQHLLAPTPEMRFLVARCLRKMHVDYDVELIAYVIMSNHWHLIVRLRNDRLPDIMRDFKGGLAKSMNKILGRRGAVWMERYHDEAVLDDEAADGEVHYVHVNPLRAHLVETLEDYPGLSSWPAYAKNLDSLTETYFDEMSWTAAGALESARAEFTHSATIEIGRPATWAGLSPRDRQRATDACVARVRGEERQLAAERARAQRAVPTADSIVRRDPRTRPKNPKRGAKRKWAVGSPEQVAAFRAAYRQMLPAYRLASAAFRQTGSLVPFPAGTYPPRIPYPFVDL